MPAERQHSDSARLRAFTHCSKILRSALAVRAGARPAHRAGVQVCGDGILRVAVAHHNTGAGVGALIEALDSLNGQHRG